MPKPTAKGLPTKQKPEEGLLPPLFENSDPTPIAEEPVAPVPPGPQVHKSPEAPAQVAPPTIAEELPNLAAVRNRTGDTRQDLQTITNRLAELQGYQSPELAQACIRATEFMFWLDMALMKAEAEDSAKQAGFDVKQQADLLKPHKS